MNSARRTRLARLEARYRTPARCGTCYGNPTQIIAVDEDGETVNGIRFPDDRCPACGRSCVGGAIRIYTMPFADFWDPEPFNWIRDKKAG